MNTGTRLQMGKSDTNLIMVRHAPASVKGLCYGRREIPTTVSATESARRIGPLLASYRIDVVWASPAQRCQAMAQQLADDLAVALVIDDRLHELDFGLWEGLTWEEISRRYPSAFSHWLEDWLNHPPLGGESTRQMEHRVADWLSVVERERTHLVVTHAGPMRAINVLLHGLNWHDAMGGAIEHLQPIQYSI